FNSPDRFVQRRQVWCGSRARLTRVGSSSPANLIRGGIIHQVTMTPSTTGERDHRPCRDLLPCACACTDANSCMDTDPRIDADARTYAHTDAFLLPLLLSVSCSLTSMRPLAGSYKGFNVQFAHLDSLLHRSGSLSGPCLQPSRHFLVLSNTTT
ncbi:uncharacterized protein F5891DRAFT_1054591, partial [Suillus fuscotomentosus]